MVRKRQDDVGAASQTRKVRVFPVLRLKGIMREDECSGGKTLGRMSVLKLSPCEAHSILRSRPLNAHKDQARSRCGDCFTRDNHVPTNLTAMHLRAWLSHLIRTHKLGVITRLSSNGSLELLKTSTLIFTSIPRVAFRSFSRCSSYVLPASPSRLHDSIYAQSQPCSPWYRTQDVRTGRPTRCKELLKQQISADAHPREYQTWPTHRLERLFRADGSIFSSTC